LLQTSSILSPLVRGTMHSQQSTPGGFVRNDRQPINDRGDAVQHSAYRVVVAFHGCQSRIEPRSASREADAPGHAIVDRRGKASLGDGPPGSLHGREVPQV
jgi:hypothetical protein